jgi:RND family efflux transporter MFP subunit
MAAATARLKLLRAGARSQEIAQAEHRVLQAKSAWEEALSAYTRAKTLAEQGVLTKANLERAKVREEVTRQDHEIFKDALELLKAGPRTEELAAAQAEIEAAESRLRLAQASQREIDVRETEARAAWVRVAQANAAVKRVTSQIREAKLVSPSNGEVAKVDLEAGETAMPGVIAFVIVDSTRLYVEGEIGDEDTSKVRVGQMVWLSATGMPGRRFRGCIEDLAAEAESKPEISLRTRVLRARVSILQGVERFRPGQEVDIEGEGTAAVKALIVPSDALFFHNNRDAVLTVANGVARLRQVSLGFRTSADTEIVGGLAAGELVVIDGKDPALDGRPVRWRQ